MFERLFSICAVLLSVQGCASPPPADPELDPFWTIVEQSPSFAQGERYGRPYARPGSPSGLRSPVFQARAIARESKALIERRLPSTVVELERWLTQHGFQCYFESSSADVCYYQRKQPRDYSYRLVGPPLDLEYALIRVLIEFDGDLVGSIDVGARHGNYIKQIGPRAPSSRHRQSLSSDYSEQSPYGGERK